MAVAVKNMSNAPATTGGLTLGMTSLVGAVALAAALAAVFVGVPSLWNSSIGPIIGNKFLAGAGFLVVEVFSIGVLVMLGLSLTGSGKGQGLLGGIVATFGWLLVTAVLVSAIGRGFPGFAGDIVAALLGIGLVFYGWQLLTKPNYPGRMQSFESQGWFTAAPYKPNQGKRVRRGTLLGLLILAGSGVWALMHGSALEGSGPWSLRVPLMDRSIMILPNPNLTVPLLAIALAGWLAYRLVNMPTFAEFLIATEGELNKIAWPTRKGLIQDTIVVLTTVVLLTIFLFVVDIAWGKILSNPYVGVLRLDTTTTKPQDQPQELDW